MNLAVGSVLLAFLAGGFMYGLGLYYGSQKDPASRVKWLKFMSFGLLCQAVCASAIIGSVDYGTISSDLISMLQISAFVFLVLSGLFYTAYSYAKDNLLNKPKK